MGFIFSLVSPYAIGHAIQEDSYLSFESALEFHQLIPEAGKVYQFASARRMKRQFKCARGMFLFVPVPLSTFRWDIHWQQRGSTSFIVAGPIKALLDWQYIHKREYQSIDDLEEDLRVDLDALESALQPFSHEDFNRLKAGYGSQAVKTLIDLFERFTISRQRLI